MPSLPDIPVPQLTDAPESFNTAIPDIEDTNFTEMPDTAVCQPEKAPERLPSKRKRIRLKTAVPILILLLVGIVAVCRVAVEGQGRAPSFSVCDAYYGDYEGEKAYYVIVEFVSDSIADDALLNYGEIIREKYEHHFSVVNQIVIIYVQDYTDYIEYGFNVNTDMKGILFN